MVLLYNRWRIVRVSYSAAGSVYTKREALSRRCLFSLINKVSKCVWLVGYLFKTWTSYINGRLRAGCVRAPPPLLLPTGLGRRWVEEGGSLEGDKRAGVVDDEDAERGLKEIELATLSSVRPDFSNSTSQRKEDISSSV
jgi:hypothetical protein